MKGIIRRIDELGRVVIPKEMRKTLRFKEGEPVEIIADADGLFIKKFLPIGTVLEVVKTIGDAVWETQKFSVIVFDNEKVIFSKGGKAKGLEDKKISKSLEKVLLERKLMMFSASENKPLTLTEDDLEFKNTIVSPIISKGDLYGAIVFATDENEPFDARSISIIKLCAEIIARQLP